MSQRRPPPWVFSFVVDWLTDLLPLPVVKIKEIANVKITVFNQKGIELNLENSNSGFSKYSLIQNKISYTMDSENRVFLNSFKYYFLCA